MEADVKYNDVYVLVCCTPTAFNIYYMYILKRSWQTKIPTLIFSSVSSRVHCKTTNMPLGNKQSMLTKAGIKWWPHNSPELGGIAIQFGFMETPSFCKYNDDILTVRYWLELSLTKYDSCLWNSIRRH